MQRASAVINGSKIYIVSCTFIQEVYLYYSLPRNAHLSSQTITMINYISLQAGSHMMTNTCLYVHVHVVMIHRLLSIVYQ